MITLDNLTAFIPPNTDHFMQINGVWCFRYGEWGYGRYWELHSQARGIDWVIVISVCERYWRIECERLWNTGNDPAKLENANKKYNAWIDFKGFK